MKANYHTHSEYCGHAEGKLSDYIEKAISLNLTALGFSEHAPFPGDPFGMRMNFNTLPEYVFELQKQRAFYQDRIRLHIGLEIEFLDELNTSISLAAEHFNVYLSAYGA
mgnify:CR=1 FL=1